MRTFIEVTHCCGVGFSIWQDKIAAWVSFDHNKVVEVNQAERQHLETCQICNPPELIRQLWPDAVVKG